MRFSKNYRKLGFIIFTTIRKNTGKHKLGIVYTMNAPAGKFKAKTIGICPIKKKEITEGLAQIDAETSKEGLIRMLDGWYGKDFDDYVLITLWTQ